MATIRVLPRNFDPEVRQAVLAEMEGLDSPRLSIARQVEARRYREQLEFHRRALRSLPLPKSPKGVPPDLSDFRSWLESAVRHHTERDLAALCCRFAQAILRLDPIQAERFPVEAGAENPRGLWTRRIEHLRRFERSCQGTVRAIHLALQDEPTSRSTAKVVLEEAGKLSSTFGAKYLVQAILQWDDALDEQVSHLLETSLQFAPDRRCASAARCNLAVQDMRAGRVSAALHRIQTARRMDPGHDETRINCVVWNYLLCRRPASLSESDLQLLLRSRSRAALRSWIRGADERCDGRPGRLAELLKEVDRHD